MSKNLSLLQNFNKSNFYNNPFPHVIIENALPEDIYNELQKSTPNDLISQSDLEKNNFRINILLDQLKNDTKYKMWHDFLSFHSSIDFYEEFISIFKDSINELYPNLINEQKKKILKKDSIKMLNNRESAYIKKGETLLTSNYGCNTPVKVPTSVVEPHLDNSNKFYFGLFYLRPEDDKSEGGDLEIYKWKDNYSNFKKKNILFVKKWINIYDHVTQVKKLVYKKNCVIFGLNCIDSLHGVTIRQKTNYIRQFTYFSGTLDKDIGFATASLIQKLLFKNLPFTNKIEIIKNFLIRGGQKVKSSLRI